MLTLPVHLVILYLYTIPSDAVHANETAVGLVAETVRFVGLVNFVVIAVNVFDGIEIFPAASTETINAEYWTPCSYPKLPTPLWLAGEKCRVVVMLVAVFVKYILYPATSFRGVQKKDKNPGAPALMVKPETGWGTESGVVVS